MQFDIDVTLEELAAMRADMPMDIEMVFGIMDQLRDVARREPVVKEVKIRQWVTTKIASGPYAGQQVIHEDHELRVGTYNEYYLPALIGMGRTSEMWITIDIDGVETKIHLKR